MSVRRIFTLLLLAILSRRLAAMPQSQRGDDAAEKDLMVPPLLDGESDFRRNQMWEDITDEDGGPRLVLLADPRHRAARTRGSIPALTRSWSHTPSDNLRVERQDSDIDVLRCMIGRVYRPCWGS
ncbi:pro-MCH [Nerophis ophidion]|uniref:pro-MCH n=1 Tax=Nerophis ophidion TaxID=159077 RepID=UPI002AE08F7D|nr:pro-MCH [Nerophis ophidion]